MQEAEQSLQPALDRRLMGLLRCPETGEPLRQVGARLVSASGATTYRIDPSGIPLFAESYCSPEAAAQQRHYDRISDVYLENLQYPHVQEYGASLDRALLEALGPARLGVVAELCCGQADAVRLLGDRIELGVGVDVSLSMLAAAGRQLSHAAFHFVQGDATRLPLADAAFDHVVMLGGVHHVPDREALFRQIHRVLKPGGRFIWREPVSDFAPWRWMRTVVYRLSPTLDDETERPLLYEETVPVLERAGLSLSSWRTLGFLGYCLLMNSDVLVLNRALRFLPGIGRMSRALAGLDAWCLKAPGMGRNGTIVVGVARKRPA
ncbi:MAG: class I SAM-dependent methyltransferase [Candidatus Polarisedimenticolia bacterium]